MASTSTETHSDEEQRQADELDGLLTYRLSSGVTVLTDPLGLIAHGTGSGLWAAGQVLSTYLASRPDLCANALCLELGSGTGVAGLTVAVHGAKQVVLTDVPDQMSLLRRNVEVNEVAQKTQCHPLDWRSRAERKALQPLSKRWTLIVGSDICYDYDLFQPLVGTLVSQCSEDTNVYFALADRKEEGEPTVADFVQVVQEFFRCREICERRLEAGQSMVKVLHLQLRCRHDAFSRKRRLAN